MFFPSKNEGGARERRATTQRAPGPDVEGRRSLCRGPALSRRSLCQGPALSVSGAGARPGALSLSVSGLGAFSLSVSGPGALRDGARRSLCQLFVSGPALSVSGLGAYLICVGNQRSVCVCVCLCVGPRRSPLLYLSLLLSGPALGWAQRYVLEPGARPALSVSWAGAGPALCVSAPGALSLSVRGPGALCPALSLCVGAGCSLCRGRALSRWALCVGAPRSLALCVSVRRSLALCPALSFCVGAGCSLRRGRVLSASGPGALCVGAGRSLAGLSGSVCRGPALSQARRSVSGALCVGLFVSRQGGLCVGPIRFRGPTAWGRSSACHPGPQPRSVCHTSGLWVRCASRLPPVTRPVARHLPAPRPPALIRAPPPGPGALPTPSRAPHIQCARIPSIYPVSRASDPCATHPAPQPPAPPIQSAGPIQRASHPVSEPPALIRGREPFKRC